MASGGVHSNRRFENEVTRLRILTTPVWFDSVLEALFVNVCKVCTIEISDTYLGSAEATRSPDWDSGEKLSTGQPSHRNKRSHDRLSLKTLLTL